ncbi:PTI1-like tyrosine-protein kinase 3 isoform X2 [Hibiscus syriacus]|uniref:PTI1-like tyrosine-protein kinase 3 isoform X2 n=1 Tax=Hibiscus syriacus TaxID=106335 RepID=UPI00192311D9|nr:PTI1-like tyrosine-protein kinase 3 isoform X2 [Hibiscus syriacus]
MPPEKRNVVVGIRLDGQSRDLLSWALVKVAEPGDCVVALHVSPSFDNALGENLLLEAYLEAYEDLCSMKKIGLKGQIFKGNSTRNVLIREANNYAAVALVLGTGKHCALGGWTSTAQYCARRLPATTDVVAIYNGKFVFSRSNNNQLPGSEISSFEGIQSLKDESRTSSEDPKISQSIWVPEGKYIDCKPGWPLLLRTACPATPQAKLARSISVVNWVMNLPSRSPYRSPRCSTIKEEPLEVEFRGSEDENMSSELRKHLEKLLKTNSSNCKWFTYNVLKAATSQFSPENLIGKGPSNLVYKGILPDDKAVAVKILKSSKEACKSFANEIEIIMSLNHKHVMPLIGVCISDHELLFVYDLSSKGSLEEVVHGKNKEKHGLTLEVRYKIAVGIAEGLNYLHNQSPQPVIHRDVKSSNILLSDKLEPKLSDFGLAIWGPTGSSFFTQTDVVGTFGYLAPEYFMYGKLCDKVDVYAFGVILLELLSGKRPINFENPEGQQSLVMWAKKIIESKDMKRLLDPDLNGNVDETRMHILVGAATLCITQSARLRPKMSEILELLRGETTVARKIADQQKDQDQNDDEVYPNSKAELHLSLLDAR